MATIQKRQNEGNVTSYRVQVRLKGHPPQTATFLRLTDARKWAQQTETAIREGRHFKTVEAKKHTLREAIERYTREILRHKKDKANQQGHLAYWQDVMGDYRLCDVTPALIIEHRNALLSPSPK
ncbi:MAG: site-specific integrase, partial [Alphaproteobacteria bacterium]